MSFKHMNYIYKRKNWMTPVLSNSSGVIKYIRSDTYGFTITVKNEDGSTTEYKNLQVVNVIPDEVIRDTHLIGYILKGRKL